MNENKIKSEIAPNPILASVVCHQAGITFKYCLDIFWLLCWSVALSSKVKSLGDKLEKLSDS